MLPVVFVLLQVASREVDGQERSEKCELVRKAELTLNLPAEVEVHAGQVRALFEHLEVAYSCVVCSCCRKCDSA